MNCKSKSIRRKTVLLSIILHLMLLLFIQKAKEMKFFNTDSQIVQPIEKRLVFELIETPDNIPQEVPQEESNLVSDKNTKVADMQETELKKSNTPYQEGDITIAKYTEQIPEINEIIPEINKTYESEQEKKENSADIPMDIQKDQLTFWDAYQNKKFHEAKNQVNYKNLLSDVLEHGGIRFNTYNWDFAPYMLAMKKKVESHINPPYAFSRLGLISGKVLVQFKVITNGKVIDLKILNSDTHYSLEQTSTRAIKFSSPFIPLPNNFPEEYLEVTALFSYIVNK